MYAYLLSLFHHLYFPKPFMHICLFSKTKEEKKKSDRGEEQVKRILKWQFDHDPFS